MITCSYYVQVIAGVVSGLGTHDGTVVTTPCSGAGTVTLHQEMVEAVNGEFEFYSCQVQL